MLRKYETIYYARTLPGVDVYEVIELMVRTVGNGWFVGLNQNDKQAYLFHFEDIDKTVFKSRTEAFEKVEYIKHK